MATADPAAFLVEALPDEVLATMEVRDLMLKSLPLSSAGDEFVIADLQRWTPGQTVRGAFYGGNTALHREIVDAAAVISQACNIHLDFGFDAQKGTYRQWSPDDTAYAAEIRVSFDQGGYFSLVGTDSVQSNIGLENAPVGGRPNQRSLNLGGFDIQKPAGWRGTVRHEFLHALAFKHEHQNTGGPCQNEFRWVDDPGYVPTRTANGVFVADSAGRRPGIYTYLSGAPNNWPKSKVDHNLRPDTHAHAVEGTFDPASVMLYRFPALFYKSSPSPCAPTGDGQELSEGDVQGLLLLYPVQGDAMAAFEQRRGELIGVLDRAPEAELPGLESLAPPDSGAPSWRQLYAEVLRQTMPRT